MTTPMQRREVITLFGGAAAATWPLAARAQQAGRMRRVGWLNTYPEDHPDGKARIAAFRQGLSELRWVEGRNLRIDYRWFQGDADAFDRAAAELVAQAPDVIVAIGGAALRRLLAVTRTVPIVFVEVNDPLDGGLVTSLARPGGNATGFTHIEYQVSEKWLDLLRQAAPNLTRVAVISNSFAVVGGDQRRQLDAIQAAARSLAVELTPLQVRDAGEIERGIAAFVRGPNDGLIVTQSTLVVVFHELIVTLAARHRLPAIFPNRAYVTEGGLMSYAPSVTTQYRNAAGYIDRILKGEKPGDLPVQQPTKYELVINRKTADALGLMISTQLEIFADEVIE